MILFKREYKLIKEIADLKAELKSAKEETLKAKQKYHDLEYRSRSILANSQFSEDLKTVEGLLNRTETLKRYEKDLEKEQRKVESEKANLKEKTKLTDERNKLLEDQVRILNQVIERLCKGCK